MRRLMRLSKERVVEASHHIPNHKGKCKNLHGHSYRIAVSLSGIHDTKNGIFVDYKDITELIDKWDHSYLNDFFKFPSAENMARYLAIKILRMNRNIIEVTVSIYETETSCATQTITNPLPARMIYTALFSSIINLVLLKVRLMYPDFKIY